jgi:osmotically-inducible protein OsmY
MQLTSAASAATKTNRAGTAPASLLKVDVDTTNEVSCSSTGTVDSERTKQRATELARQVEGVGRVVNNLKVQG